jgi:peptidoglycan/xylan/chitin deacetylase (PgdA/CDA1 family)
MRAVLTFHSVDDSGSVLSIAPQALRALVRAIRSSGHEIIPLTELLSASELPNRVALSFDDGMASVPEAALPILREEGAPATLFVTTDYLGRDNQWPTMPGSAPRMRMADWKGIEDLCEAGWAIEAHTATHPDLRKLSDQTIEDELLRCDEAIENRLGRAPVVFAYPYGYCDDRVVEHARRRYRFAVTAQMGQLPAALGDPMRVPRLETFYFRDPVVHRHFGSFPFRGYLELRRMIRELRAR